MKVFPISNKVEWSINTPLNYCPPASLYKHPASYGALRIFTSALHAININMFPPFFQDIFTLNCIINNSNNSTPFTCHHRTTFSFLKVFPAWDFDPIWNTESIRVFHSKHFELTVSPKKVADLQSSKFLHFENQCDSNFQFFDN